VNGKKIETELYLQKRKIDKNKMEFELLVDEEPIKAGIDPYNKLIDRTPDNNSKSFKGGDKDAPSNEGGVTVTIGS
jgi:ABC-2 type transport system permease protein